MHLLSSDEARRVLQRRSLRVVVLCQALGGLGLAAGITVGALLAEDMLGGAGLAGLPSALFTLGSALSAYAVGRVSQRAGRRIGLAGGFLVAALGAAGIVLAAHLDSVWLLFPALFVYGSGFSTNLQTRYAATDLAAPDHRATAVSVAMVATTLGAVVGPNSVGLLGELATGLGLPALAGPFLLAAVAYVAAGLVLLLLLRPDPYLVARALHEQDAAAGDGVAPVGDPATVGRGVVLAATVMVLTQVAMVAIMTMTPVHMEDHQHGLEAVGFVISVHIAAMYLPSLVTGRLVDRVGRRPMATAAAVTLLAAGWLAALAPGGSLVLLTLALALLGLGWNFGLISGTALIVDSTPLEGRARTQGSVDVLIALAGAGGAALSGMVVAGAGYPALAIGGGLLSLLLLPALTWSRRP